MTSFISLAVDHTSVTNERLVYKTSKDFNSLILDSLGFKELTGKTRISEDLVSRSSPK